MNKQQHRGIIEVEVKEGSMVELPKGSRAFIDTADHRFQDGSLYAFESVSKLGSCIMFRRAYLSGAGKVLCRASNPEFPSFELEVGKPLEGFNLLGRVGGAVVTFQ